MRSLPLFLYLLLASCGAPASGSEPRFDQDFAPSGNGKAPSGDWPADRAISCDPPPKSGPSICIGPADKSAYRKGDPVAARLSWRNVPAGASVIVYLERDAPPREPRYLGPVGALVLHPLPADGDGDREFRWNGREFPCAPTDFPMLCPQPAEIGRYRLRAVLYDRRAIAIVGWPSPEKPVVLAHSASAPFQVTGKPDLQPIARALWWGAVNKLMKDGELPTSGIMSSDTNGTGLDLYEARGLLCAAIAAKPPYRSDVVACVPKAKVQGEAGLVPVEPDDVAVTGHVSVMSGRMSRDDAILLARKVADAPYRSKVRFHRQPSMEEAGYDGARDGDFQEWSRRNPNATTYLSDSIGETVYRPDLGGAWVVIVNEIMAGGSVPDSERFAEKVMVLVQPDRRACVIETIPYKGASFGRDPATAALRC
ncbi:MAG TPA: hypothetical protein VIT45_02760 [Allosphingosinicella sp.]